MTDHEIKEMYRVIKEEASRRSIDFPNCRYEDLHGVGVEKCVNAYHKWSDGDSSHAWSKHARMTARGHMINHIRKYGLYARQSKKQHRGIETSIQRPMGSSDNNERTLEDLLESPENPQSLKEEYDDRIFIVGPKRSGQIRIRLAATGTETNTTLPFGLIRRAIETYLTSPYPSANDVAKQFGIQPRTLSRKLSDLKIQRSRSHQKCLDVACENGEVVAPEYHTASEAWRLTRPLNRKKGHGTGKQAADTLNRDKSTVYQHLRRNHTSHDARMRRVLRPIAIQAMKPPEHNQMS